MRTHKRAHIVRVAIMALAQIARKVVKQRHLYQVIEDEINIELSKYAPEEHRCAHARCTHQATCSAALHERRLQRRRRRPKAVLVAPPDYTRPTVVFTMLQRQAAQWTGARM